MEKNKNEVDVMEEKILLTPMECAKYLGVGQTAMYEDLLKRKDFPYFKIGVKYFINKARLQEWIDKQCK